MYMIIKAKAFFSEKAFFSLFYRHRGNILTSILKIDTVITVDYS